MRRHTGIPTTGIVAGLIALCGMSLPAVAGATPPTGITGTVTNASSATHEPIANLNVCVSAKSGGSECILTQTEGKYTLGELTAGEEYTVEFTGRVCMNGCERYEQEFVKQVRTSVQVTSGNLTEVNGPLLEIDGKISGRITSGGVPLENIEVCASESVSKVVFGCQTTNPGGEYTITDLPPGSYNVEFSPLAPPSCKGLTCQPANYITGYWNNALTLEAAGEVTVHESETKTGINAELQPGGHISGKVTTASIYPQPIVGVHVCSRSTRTNKEGEREGVRECAYTNAGGEYSIQTLASGGYEVEFTGKVCTESSGGAIKCTHPYIAQFYQSIVSVTAPGTTSGIDASLLEVSPTKPALTAAPTVTGTAAVGKTLSCSQGTWANNPTNLAYRWLRNGVAIAGQTSNTYTLQRADAGNGIVCEVIATNAAGATVSTSNTVQIPALIPGLAVLQGVSVRGATISVTLRCTGTNPCSGAMRIRTRLTTDRGRHRRTRTVTIGLASFSIGLGHSATFRVYLTGQGRQLLRRAGRGGLRVQIAGIGIRASTVVLRQPRRGVT
ncbi:MAG: hypothetical protein ACLQQB_00295 [Solirubrobacteraceae bacterium]|jgi:hypothetical protein